MFVQNVVKIITRLKDKLKGFNAYVVKNDSIIVVHYLLIFVALAGK